MFGLSLTKILFTVGAIAAVWKVFRYLEARGKAQLKGDTPPDSNPRAVEELVECTICSTYVPAKESAPCERPDCPYLP